jgi:hypothetical protein
VLRNVRRNAEKVDGPPHLGGQALHSIAMSDITAIADWNDLLESVELIERR